MTEHEAALLGREGWRWTAAEPSERSVATRDSLTWSCAADTDFWRLTQGHPSKHDGQAYLVALEGDFTFEAAFDAKLAAQFDQAGLLVERDTETWLKAGVELDGRLWLSAVHTRGDSDWSREPIDGLPLRLRVERRADTVTASALIGDSWQAFRVLTLSGAVRVGPYACAPRGQGFETHMYDALLVT